jgi:hypothetical protein
MSVVESEAIAIWKRALTGGPWRSWVVFAHGTCVGFKAPKGDLADQARALLAEWGPVYSGSPWGDFTVGSIKGVPQHIVACHHPDILNYVSLDEVEASESDVVIGVKGRAKRREDARELIVIHVERAESDAG